MMVPFACSPFQSARKKKNSFFSLFGFVLFNHQSEVKFRVEAEWAIGRICSWNKNLSSSVN